MWQARSENTDIPTLLIPAIRVADSGFYLCVATSPTGTAQARIQVVVLSGTGSPSRAGIMGKGEPRLSETCLLRCGYSFRCQLGASQDRILITIRDRRTDP